LVKKVIGKNNLSRQEIFYFLDNIAIGRVTSTEIVDFLSALAIKGETAEEVFYFAEFISQNALHIGPFENALDIHGTGGDGSGSFNISSTVIFVVSAAGVTIAKHGNRSSSGRSGAADVLEALGVNINLEPKEVEDCIKRIGMGFMFAQKFHPKLQAIAEPRRRVGTPTVFNKAFPLVSPANVKNHFLGVTDWRLAPLFADVLKKSGCKRFALVHGRDPMDEVSLSSETDVWEYLDGKERQYVVTPESFGFTKKPLSEIRGGTPEDNAQITKDILSGKEQGPKRDIVILNAAVSFVVAGKVHSVADGVSLARDAISSGKAIGKLNELIRFSNG